MPNIPPFVSIVRKEKLYKITSITQHGNVAYIIEQVDGLTFDVPSKAYDYITRYLQGTPVFVAEELTTHGEGSLGMFLEKGTNRFLICHTLEDTLNGIARDYEGFLAVAEDYRNNPEDWVLAYQFIEFHPVFWHQLIGRQDSWKTDGGWNDAWITVFKNDKRENLVMIEHGPYFDDELKDGSVIKASVPSHELELDVLASDYHEAIIQFAKKVDAKYNLNGTEKAK